MKELSIEEKAARYDDAIKRIEDIETGKCETTFMFTEGLFEHIFPELAESEDEKIKDLIYLSIEKGMGIPSAEDRKKALAWLEKKGENNMGISEATKQKLEDNLNKALEKETPESWNEFLEVQGEQEPTDKVELKFNVGDWVIVSTSDEEKVVQIDSIEYFKSGEPKYITSEGRWFGSGTKARPWTIQDAKDGDILVNEDGLAFIYNNYLEEQQYPFAYGGINLYGRFNLCDGLLPITHQKVYPATKEQRGLLFQKIKESGYAWDADKKELKKIERGTAWSEEDKKMFDSIINVLEVTPSASFIPIKRETMIPWLKSLKERYTWKPSDEQMKTLEYYMNALVCNHHKEILFSLYQDLKEL